MMNIKQAIIPKDRKRRPGITLKPTHITIHNTGCENVPADNFRRSCLDPSQDKEVSWHYTVDEKEIIQHIPDNEVAWHAGDRTGNRCSIGIEICERDGAEEHAIELVRHLMQKHNIPIDRVVTHKSWSGKQCPRLILGHWSEFIIACNRQETYKIEIMLNDKLKEVDAINQDGFNFVKLRDLADAKIVIDYDREHNRPIVHVKG